MKKIKEEKEIINWRIFFQSLLVVLFLTSFIFLALAFVDYTNNKQEKANQKKLDIMQSETRSHYIEYSMRLVNETGIPSQYSCEDIQIRIQTGIYPKKESIFHCKSSPEDTFHWCRTSINPNTKEAFVEYYLLNCLEMRQ